METKKLYEPTPLLGKMAKFYYEMRAAEDSTGSPILCNEGGARSGKTVAEFDFIELMCDHNRPTDERRALAIYIVRDTLTNCRDFTLPQFIEWLKLRGLYDKKKLKEYPKPEYNLHGTPILFRGFSDDENGESFVSDIVFVNEALDCRYNDIVEMQMRNRVCILLDWNPKYTDNPLFLWEKRDNVKFLRTTYRNNIKNLTKEQISNIENYSPWLLEDCKVDKDGHPVIPEAERRPHKENIANGTANKWAWEVYGMGMRANKEGLVFRNVSWIDEFPYEVDEITYGMDMGIVAATAVVKVGYINGGDKRSSIICELLFYEGLQAPDDLEIVLNNLAIGEKIHCDNNFIGWIARCRRSERLSEMGYTFQPTAKWSGSKDNWITTIKNFNIILVRDKLKGAPLRKEQENMSYDGDSKKGKTKDGYDDAWSAIGYAVVGEFRNRK